ncbi:MAG: hypothetical protein RBR06_06615 [Desulfuromonadaceae bacterium]|nr:hypothetical protein [Desulfuromonadaceae bacterium]
MKAVETPRRKLLNFSVNRAMQFRMIGKISLILFASQLISGLIFFYFSNQAITTSFQMFHIKARNFLDFLLPVILAAVLVSLVIGFVASLFFPKPIAGSLYRIESDLRTVIDSGDLRVQIKLRKGDQATLLAAQVNILLNDLRQRIDKSQQALEQLHTLCAEETKIDPAELQKVNARLQEQLGGLQT